MAQKKLDKHVVDRKFGEWPRLDRQVESTEPQAQTHPRPAKKKKAERPALRLVSADEEERAEDVIDGALGRKVADDEA
jgi:hypothetical protein